MNRPYFRLLLPAACAAAMIAASCSGNTSDGSTGPEGITDFNIQEVIKTASRSYRLITPYDTVFLELSTTLQWPQKLGKVEIDSLQSHLLRTAYDFNGSDPDNAIIAFLTDFDLFDDSITATVVDTIPKRDDPTGLYEMMVTANVLELTSMGITYNVSSMSYLGGAHPNTVASPFTYIFDARKVLTAENAFVAGSAPYIEQAIRESLAAQYNVKPSRLTDAGFFSNEIPMSSSVYASQGCLVFHYNHYEIAPYSQGAIDVEVQPFAIRRWLTPLAASYFE